MTHSQENRQDIPGLPTDAQPPEAVIDAYWDAITLIEKGWQLTRFDYDARIGSGTVSALTPGGRAITVGHRLHGKAGRHHGVQFRGPLGDLARKVAGLGVLDCRRGDDELLTALRWLVQSRAKAPHRPEAPPQIGRLPTLPAAQQPTPSVRAAAWIIAALVVEKHWRIACVGQDVAAGGFLAEVPGEVLAVYPSTMAADGTSAATLARLVGRFSHHECALLERLDYHALYAADRQARQR
jgi:hypothetical protein